MCQKTVKTVEQKPGIDLDRILLEEIGNGKYQLRAVAPCGLAAFLVGYSIMGYLFTAARTKTSIMSTCMALGTAVQGLVASSELHWRHLVLIFHVPLFISASFYWILPESVRWLISKDRINEAKKMLIKAADTNGKTLSDNTLKSFSEEIIRRNAEEEKNDGNLLCLVFKHKTVLLHCIIAPIWWISVLFVTQGMAITSVNISGNRYLNYSAVALVAIPGMAFFSGLLVLLTPENLGSTLPESMEDANNLGKDQPSLLRSFTTKLFKRRQNLCTALDISTILRTPLNGPDYLKKIRNGAIAQQRELTGSEASKQKDLSEKSFTKVVIKSWAADWMSASSGADSGAGNGAGNGAENDTGFAAKEMNEKNKCLNYTRVGFAAKEMNEKNKCLNYTRVLIGFLEELRSPGCAFPTIIAVTAVVAGTRHPLSIIVQANRHLTQRSILNRDVCSYDVARNDKYGRYLTANKDIESGELIFTDKPFAYGPKPDSPPLCLGCYCPVAESLCARCGWPACGAECAAAPAHAAECAVFARARVNVVTFLLEHCRLGDRFDKELVQQVCGILESASASSNLHQSRPAPPPLLHARAVPDADAARLPVGVQVLLVRLPALRRPHGARLASQHPQMQQLYGRVAGYGIDELPDLLLERKAELARLVLAALDAVAPGDTRMRGESAAWLVRVVVMESAACRRRASDAEQSARWTYSVTAECEPVAVKEEPEGGECGVSEAAVAEGLYAGHEVKDEVVIGPVTVQQQDVAFSMQNAFCRLEGPCSLKPEGGADDTPDCTHTCLGEGPRCNRSPEQQYRLTSCFVRLERLPVGDLHRGKPCSSMQAIPSASALRRSREQGQRHTLNRTEVDPCQLQPAGGAGAAPECTHTRPGEGPRCNMSHDQQFQLRSCSVRLERILIEDLPTCDTCSLGITKGAKCREVIKKTPVFFMPPLLSSADTALEAGVDAGLPYLISDDCFDTWVGNPRGTYYGRRHIRLDPDKDKEFWEFSVDEIGTYDIPAMIDYVSNKTGEDKITKGAKCKEVIKKTPVFFMPPLLSSADTALEAGVDAGLPYLISDDCFDTWVGNARGTYYGRRHIRLDPDKDKEFWEFSVDEIGTYDIPAMIDYVSNKTGEDKLGITKGAKCKKVIKKTPVFFMPPLLSSADTALEAGVDAGLPYLISDDCFDTWVGNPRGTYYGRRHIRLDPDRDKEFWEFSVDEIGTYDIPAMVDYVSNKTGED
ncbi:hypothetical protein MSG28_010059, partial [Choristoneura fumiferana]